MNQSLRSARSPVPSEWISATVIDARTDEVLLSQSGDHLRSTASVGKLLLLLELAERIAVNPAARSVVLSRRSVEPISDSGLWQHLQIDELTVGDLATMVGAFSDNLATNVLLQHVGLDAVTARAEHLGLAVTRLHDIVRESRGVNDPTGLSTGTTDELAQLMAGLFNDDSAGAQVLKWIANGTDLSMVAHAFGLDPLSHGAAIDRGFEVWSKTGTDLGVRADVGLVRHNNRTLAYAAVANWPSSTDDNERDDVLRSMHDLGHQLRSLLAGDRTLGSLRFGI